MTHDASEKLPSRLLCLQPAAGREIRGRGEQWRQMSSTVDICSFITTAYKCIDIWVKIDWIQYMQHFLCDIDLAHAHELKASFHHCGVDYSHAFITVTAVQSIVEPFDPSDLLDCYGKGRWCYAATALSEQCIGVTASACWTFPPVYRQGLVVNVVRNPFQVYYQGSWKFVVCDWDYYA